MRSVFILGAYGQHNLGDDALLEVFVQQFPAAHIVVNSARPEETRRRYGVDAVATTHRGLPRLRRLRALLRADMIVFGGGSLLKEIEGSTAARLIYFVRILLLLLFGKLAGRPTVMLGVGIGPLHQSVFIWLSRIAANLTGLICVRDAESRDLLQRIGVRRPIHVTADPVFLLPLLDSGPEPAADACIVDAPYVVVVPRYSLDADAQAALAAGCDALVERYGVHVLLVPFQTGFLAKYDDLVVARSIKAQMRHAAAARIWQSDDPCSVLKVIGAAELVISARLHGLIFAATRGVAPIAVSYEVKIASFMAEHNLQSATIDVRELHSAKLLAVLDDVWRRRGAIGAELRVRREGMQQQAGRTFELAHEYVDRHSGVGMLGASALLFASMTLVNAGNYLFNIVLGRWLGPSAFADVSLIVTLLLIVTLVTSTLQTVAAKFIATYAVDADLQAQSDIRRWLIRRAGLAGVLLGAGLAIGAPLLQSFFHARSAWLFVLLGLGIPLYFIQGVERGVLQGRMRFGLLALGYQAEMWTRLLLALGLVALGWSVLGAVAALPLSFVAAWLVVRRGSRALPLAQPIGAAEQRRVWRFAGPVSAALVGQIVINNSDVLIVKHFFGNVEAGQYAALALIGRIVFFATWSIVMTMFPLVVQKQQRQEPHRHLFWLSLGLVTGVSAAIIVATLLVPGWIVRTMFGAAYLPISELLCLYAIATMLFALSNVVINYHLSLGRGTGSALVVLAGLVQLGALWMVHGSLRDVVMVQICLMGGLLVMLLAWDVWLAGVERRRVVAPLLDGAS